MKKWITMILALGVVVSFGATFESTDQFSITLPDAWCEIPLDVLEEYAENLAALVPDTPRQIYNYGYQLRASDEWLQYPYILVQVKNDGRVPEGELTQFKKLKESLSVGLEQVKGDFSDLLSNASFGEPVYDEANYILWTTLSMDMEGIGVAKALIAVRLTETGFIQFMGYAIGDQFDEYVECFRSAFIQAELEESILYQSLDADPSSQSEGIRFGRLLAAGMNATVVAGIIWFVFYFNKRKKRAS